MTIGALTGALADLGHPSAGDLITRGERHGLGPLRALLVGGIPLSVLQAASWDARGYERIELDPARLDADVVGLVGIDVCRRARAVVVGRVDGCLVIAVADPSDITSMDELRAAVDVPWRVVVAAAESIDEAIRRLEATQMMSESDATRTVDAIITYAVSARASDIHISCTGDAATVRIRLDGVLHEYAGVRQAAALIGRVKVLGGLDLGQRRLPQDGRMQAEVAGRGVDIRVATLPTVWEAEDAVLRILDTSTGVAALDALGLSVAARAAWARLWRAPYGLVLVAGPTGCGKSTTLYATLREVATPDKAVRTVEDPVEVRIPGITQVQVNPRAGLTFASALRAFLRADPDIILVGEIRDHETARVATEAAVTGHLVLATVHTASAAQVPLRLIEMGVPGYLVSAALRGAMGQRLVRRLCTSCRTPDARPTGCARCAHTGYRGRLAVGEVMVVDERVQRAIAAQESLDNMTALAISSGMVPLRDAIADVVSAGETSLSELARVTDD